MHLKKDGHSRDLLGVSLEAVAEVTAMGQVQAHDAVMWLQQRSVHLRWRMHARSDGSSCKAIWKVAQHAQDVLDSSSWSCLSSSLQNAAMPWQHRTRKSAISCTQQQLEEAAPGSLLGTRRGTGR